MNFEVRYMGALLEHFDTESLANAYRDKRLAHAVEGPAFDAKQLTVAPRRPFSLFCRGALVDTFASDTEAAKRREAILKEHAERRRTVPRLMADDFEISKGKFASLKKRPAASAD